MGVRMEAVRTAVQPAAQTARQTAIKRSEKSAVSVSRQPKICLIFATRGRAELLGKAIAFVDMQTVKPDLIIVSCVTDEDVCGLASRPGLLVVKGRAGLTAQRNNALNHVPDGFDVLVFLDDDFLMHRTWMAAVLDAFDSDPSIACVTGMTLADGINGPGYSFEEGRKILAETKHIPHTMVAASTGGPYGCNMAFRARSVAGLRFDERLVLYGWQEDRDFGGQIWNRGDRVVRINTALGVHLGTKAGRMSGRRLGYSQVINPLYLARKKTMPLRDALDHVLRNIFSNFTRSFSPESWVDRRGRLNGNLIGVWDFLRGRLTPERAEKL
jgi:glycosyltransferase involved in cell wall biosynthesis